MAEIAYVSLLSTDLTLVGVVDNRRTGRSLDLVICGTEHLSAHTLAGISYTHVVVTSVRHGEAIRAHLDARAVPSSPVSCIEHGMAAQG